MTVRPSPSHNPDLRRRHPRVALLWAGRLQSPSLGASAPAPETAPCAILNLSNGGARLRLAEAGSCPSRIELESAHFGRLAARVVWRKGNDLGLAFLEAPKAIAALLGTKALRPSVASA
ncbi:MAG: PilZ domain-containing protein [Kiloniellales bacterium]